MKLGGKKKSNLSKKKESLPVARSEEKMEWDGTYRKFQER